MSTDVRTLTGEFRYLPVDRVVYGPGQVARLPALVEQLGGQRVFLITGRSLATQTNLVRQLEELLGPRHVGTFAATRQHVPASDVIAAAMAARAANADLLLSFGGGSPVDCAKLVALVLADEIPDADTLLARANRQAPVPPHRTPLPQIAVTTTLSAGEFTAGAGVTNEATRIKHGYNHPSLAPKIVVLDPTLTLATPARLWASTGLKALDHAIERLYSPRRQPFTDALCTYAIRLLLAHLPASIPAEPATYPARVRCQLAAWMSIFGMNNVPVGLGHALGHQIGAGYDVPHGITSCITLPHVLRFLGKRMPDRLDGVAAAFGLPANQPGLGDQLAERVADFVARLGLPTRLREVGVPAERLAALAQAVAEEIHAREPVSVEDLEALLVAAW